MNSIRPSAVAGYFYPKNKDTLLKQIQTFIYNSTTDLNQMPYAIISPHAGYLYSGPIAGSAYKVLLPHKSHYKKILLLGPSHFVPIQGLAYPACQYFETPLGKIKLDLELLETLKEFDFVYENSSAHAREHSLEVQIPFLLYIFGEIPILPLVFGKILPEKISTLLKKIWSTEMLIIISSDLSHYYSYNEAKELDKKTSIAIQNLEPDSIGYEQACGRVGIQGLLLFAKEKNWKVHLLDLRNSGDTAGSKKQVVGYGAWSFTDGSN